VQRISWIAILALLALPAAPTRVTASILPVSPSSSLPKNGLLKVGLSLLTILDESNPESLWSKCSQEGTGMQLFANSCKSLVDQLQKKLNLMTLESDIQIQAERIHYKPNLTPNSRNPRHTQRERIALLRELNLLSTQAEDALQSVKTEQRDPQIQEHLSAILPGLKKVQTSFLAYSRLLTHGNR